MIWKFKHRELDLSHRGHLMGILNATPDSFSDGGQFDAPDAALAHALRMGSEGATIIDIGGESTRPGAAIIPEQEEIDRTAPVIRRLREEWDGLISIDTQKAAVASAALAEGADIVNDVSGFTADPAMIGLCASAGCGIVIMHMRGTPADMQESPEYEDVVSDVGNFFKERLTTLAAAGIDPACLCFDPGIGFGKTLEHNLALLKSLSTLAPADRPLLLGVSRKSMIATITGAKSPADCDAGTIALTAFARSHGIMLHRVHDVQGNLQALRLAEALQ